MSAGWDFKESENLTVCKDMQPWYDYCKEPPCGQVRVKEGSYRVVQLDSIPENLSFGMRFDRCDVIVKIKLSLGKNRKRIYQTTYITLQCPV